MNHKLLKISFISRLIGHLVGASALFLCGGLLALRIYSGNFWEFLAISLATALWTKKSGFWALPLGLGIVFYGKNPSFYQDAPFDTYLITIIFFELLSSFVQRLFSGKDFWFLGPCQNDNMTKTFGYDRLLSIVFFFFVCWIFYRSFDLIPLLKQDCQIFGFRECSSTLLLAHSGSSMKGIRTALSWFLGFGVFFLLKENAPARKHIILGLVASAIFTLAIGFRHLGFWRVFPAAKTLCQTHYLCNVFLTREYPSHQGRFISFFGNPGWYGQYLIFLFPLFLYLCHKSWVNKKVISFLLSATALCSVIFQALATSQRIVWIAIFGQVVISIFYYSLQILKQFKNRSTARLVNFLLFAGSILFLFFIGAISSPWVKQKLHFESKDRAAVWQLAPTMLQNNFLQGVGTGRFASALQSARTLTSQKVAALEDAHNSFLQILVETGTVGLALLLASCVIGFFVLWKKHDLLLAKCLSLAMIGIFIDSLAQDIIYIRAIHYFFFIMLAFIYALVANQENGNKIASFLPNKNIKVTLIHKAILLFLLFSTYALAPPPSYSGCYLKEISEQGRYYRWCRAESLLYFKNVKGNLTIFLDSIYKKTIFAQTLLDGNGLQTKTLHLKSNHLRSLEFVASPIRSGPGLGIKINSLGYNAIEDDHRQLSYLVFIPEERCPLPIANIKGLYQCEGNETSSWRWTRGEAEFRVLTRDDCKTPKLTVITDFPRPWQNKNSIVTWTVNAEKGSLEFTSNKEIKIPLPPGSISNVSLSINRTFVPKNLGTGDDNRNLGLKIVGVVCNP